MSTVAQDVQQIREAIYGRDVREAIADGIEHCYSDVSGGVTTANTAAAAANAAAQRANTAAAGAEGIPGTASLEDLTTLKNAICDFEGTIPDTITSCDQVKTNSLYFVSMPRSSGALQNWPIGTTSPGWLETRSTANGGSSAQIIQFAYPWQQYAPIYYRMCQHGSTWTKWLSLKTTLYDTPSLSRDSNFGRGEKLSSEVMDSTDGGLAFKYDQDKGMVKITGTYSADYIPRKNIVVEDHGLCGLKAGQTYRLCVRADPISLDSLIPEVEVYINYTTSGEASWQFAFTVRYDRVSAYTIPANANGLLVRYYCRQKGTYNCYASLECVRSDMLTPHMMSIFYGANNIATRDEPPLPSGATVRTCNDAVENGIYFNSVSSSVKTFSDFPFDSPGWLWNYRFAGNDIQIAMSWSAPYSVKYRTAAFGVWHEWQSLADSLDDYLPSCDLDSLTSGNHFYLLIDSQTYEHTPLPSLTAGFLEIKQSANWGKQIFYHLREGKSWVRTFSNGAIESNWVLSEGGSGNTYNVTQEISRDNFQNTYNITTSPSITTDTNNYLQAIDNESTAEANATDMTGAIMSMLSSTGHCKLGPGTFYVSGNINMPNGAMLEGCGKKTIVRLLSSVTSGYIVRIGQHNTIKDINFSGGKSVPTNLYTDGTNLGTRHGIYLIANADGKEESQPQALQNFITNCFFENFDGSAFYTHNTGGGLKNNVTFTDSFIEHCRVGINIDYYAEYAKFSQIIIYQCYYACINNGGNNVFTGCTFHGVVGWLTDNSGMDKSNNQHGSCVGCTFNHIDNMNHPDVLGNGKAVHIINGVAGFIFTGCQLWYGNVYIENSVGVQFSDCLFGNNKIEIHVTGSNPAFFFDNIFWTSPTLDVTNTSIFEGNYLKNGQTVTP